VDLVDATWRGGFSAAVTGQIDVRQLGGEEAA